MTATAADAELTLQAGETFSIGQYNSARLLAFGVAAGREGSADPVDVALRATLEAQRPYLASQTPSAQQVDPARPDRRYSLTRVNDVPDGEGNRTDLIVMRGDLTSVLDAARIGREDRIVLTKNARKAQLRGYRPLAIATARINPDGTPRTFQVQGFIGLRPSRGERPAAGWVRVDLWSATLRVQHWINVVVIFVLSCTGYYIMDPFFGPSARDGAETGYLMGWVRLVHFVAAFIWLAVGTTRVLLAFRSRDRYLRWPALWPLNNRQDVRYLGQVVGHYSFLRRHAPLYLAHNPLQQLAYTALYVLGFVQMLTGLVLYGLYHQGNWFWHLTTMPTHWFGTPGVRLFHTMIMFLLWAFTIMHIYLAVRADSLERHGGVSSMINGGVYVRRGSKPVDAPEIE